MTHCTPLQKRSIESVSVEVRKSQHKYIVGPRGHVLQEILQTTGVWVDVPSTESDSSTITLRGTQDKLGQALTQVRRCVCMCVHVCACVHLHGIFVTRCHIKLHGVILNHMMSHTIT